MVAVVHELRRENVDDLIILGRMFCNECGPHLVFDEGRVREYCEYVFADLDREHFNIFIAYKDGEPVGALVAYATQYAFSRQILAQQDLWYVIPALRGTRVAFKLIQAFEEWARLRGAVEIFTGVTHGDGTKLKRIGSVLTRMGYPKVGTFHKKRTV